MRGSHWTARCVIATTRDLMNAAIARATAAYNVAVDNNNHVAQTRSLSWLAAFSGQSRAFAFRAHGGYNGTFDDYQLIA